MSQGDIAPIRGRISVDPPSCDHCDDMGVVYESCGCNECEYDNKHGRDIPCANCQLEAA
jgi:hypothetical protein